LQLWDVTNPSAEVREFVGHERLISSLSFSPDGSWLASTSYDGTVRLWALDVAKLLQVTCQVVPQKLLADELRAVLATTGRTDLNGSDLLAAACREPLRDLARDRDRLAATPGLAHVVAAITALEGAWNRAAVAQP
jgi:WD40 repeat protein